MTESGSAKPKRRWYRLRADRLLIALLPVLGVLYLSERFQWFAFNEHEDRTLWIALGVVAVAVLILLLAYGVSLLFHYRSRLNIQSWFRLTPDRFLIALLPVLGLLYLSERFRWLPFNEHKGWTVLIALGVVFVAVLFLLMRYGMCLVLRRRFQFYVRSLLLLVVVVAVACSWLALEIQQASRQQKAVQAIREADGVLQYDYEFRGIGPSSPPWLRNLLGDDFFCHVTFVSLAPHSGDAGLADVARLTGVKFLETPLQATDDGLQHVRGLAALAVLDLDSPQITDAGLEHLMGLPNLTFLDVDGTKVTHWGVRNFVRALPNCRIVHEPISSVPPPKPQGGKTSQSEGTASRPD